MFETKLIQSILKRHIDKGIDQFVIYPFGINGVNVKTILKEYYGLNPCFIVDNEYYKYNPDIISRDTLKSVYRKEMYVILAVEDQIVNKEIRKGISEYIPNDNIIDVFEIKQLQEKVIEKSKTEEQVRIKCYNGKGFLLSDFLPSQKTIKEDRKKSGKVKVRISHSSVNNWNAISKICQAFREDSTFELLLIIDAVDFKEKAILQAQEGGNDYIIWEKYQIEEDRPDIMILTNLFGQIVAEGVCCKEFAKLVIVAYMQLVMYNNESIEQFWAYVEKGFGRHRPDYYLFDSLLYKELSQLNYYSANIVEMGNAKFDGIYQAVQRKEYSKRWKKLEGKQTVLWATSHGVYDKVVTPNITFDLYAKTVFEYVYNHPDIGLIFRPHNVFVSEMLKSGFWNEGDVKQIRIFCENSPNVVFDDMDTYNISFAVADGILTDAYCGILCSALPTLKPVGACYRSKGDSPNYRGLLDSCYSVYEEKDIITFFEMIKSEQDPMLELRKRASKDYVKHFDGKNGCRIKEFIKKKYYESKM